MTKTIDDRTFRGQEWQDDGCEVAPRCLLPMMKTDEATRASPGVKFPENCTATASTSNLNVWLIGALSPGTMMAAMFKIMGALINKHQIIDTIVCLIKIDMVDRFTGAKRPTQCLFHNPPMLTHSPTWSPKPHISFSIHPGFTAFPPGVICTNPDGSLDTNKGTSDRAKATAMFNRPSFRLEWCTANEAN